jgi:hypothetical protein
MNKQWNGKLHHDKSPYADWGMIRDETGKLIMRVQMPYMTTDQENEHRRNRTDPSQDLIDYLLLIINKDQNQTTKETK